MLTDTFRDLYFPHVVGCFCCDLSYILGTVVISLESHCGHNRAKNDLGIVFDVLSCKQLIDCLSAMVGLRIVLGAGMLA